MKNDEVQNKLKSTDSIKKPPAKKIDTFYKDLENILVDDVTEIELDKFLRETKYKKEESLNFLSTLECKNKFKLKESIIPVEYVKFKKIFLRQLRNEIKQKIELNIIKENSQLIQLIELIKDKYVYTTSELCHLLNISSEEIKSLFNELKRLGDKGILKIEIKEKKVEYIQRII